MGQQRCFERGPVTSAIAPIATKMARRSERRKGQCQWWVADCSEADAGTRKCRAPGAATWHKRRLDESHGRSALFKQKL